MYNAKYMGYFCAKTVTGQWSEDAIDVFYVENPDRSKGHTNYFGLYQRRDPITFEAGAVMITNAESCFSEPMVGIIANDGEVVISRYRHDMTKSRDGSVWVDGGRDYTRSGPTPNGCALVTVKDGEFIIERQEERHGGNTSPLQSG